MAVDDPEVQAQQAGRAKRVEDPRQGDMERFMEVGPCPDPALQPCVCRTLFCVTVSSAAQGMGAVGSMGDVERRDLGAILHTASILRGCTYAICRPPCV